MLDLEAMKEEEGKEGGVGLWKWKWPRALAAWDVNNFSELPAPLYIAEESLTHDVEDDKQPVHPDLEKLFSGFDTSPHRGRVYQPSPRLRLWQQERAKEQQELRRRQRTFSLSSKNPYDRMQ